MSDAPVGTLTGIVVGVLAYLLFSWGMANGLIPVPSRRTQRRGALAILVIAAVLLLAQLGLMIWAQLEG